MNLPSKTARADRGAGQPRHPLIERTPPMPRFHAPAATPSYGSGFDSVALRDTFADFRNWWDRNCLLDDAEPQAEQEASLARAA